MKRILFPTDFSAIATNAFVHALAFAKILHGELIILHSYPARPIDDQFFAENFKTVYDTVELTQFDMFKEEVPKLHAIATACNLDNIKMTHRLMEGELVDNIKKSVEEDKIDFVVMGTSGITEWDAVFVGSNSGDVIIGITVPVLCVPLDSKYKTIKTIGFTTRYRAKDKQAIQTVVNLAKHLNAKLKCLYVKTSNSDVSKETIAEWETEFETQPIEFFIVESDVINEAVMDFIAFENVDVLTMLTYKRGFFKGLFQPSYTKMAHPEFHIPILAIPID
ncbi:universal stress protein [Flavobacterium hiemivividum]|uniref:Universal stress protein n=1 Tax=Flavobacterium hiemivividum TaxID=2541734 RepID=A0A4V2Z0H7_9FLAO|nr:universal stress protein [Flavobacterium hiemivividum]TDE00998.1 universal stress protein [Flavobacterium hiemivividum]